MAYSRLTNQNWLVSESQDLRGPGFPLPEGALLGRREKTGFQPQLYIEVPPDLICDQSREYGYVANIRHDAVQLNTRSPFTFQIVFKLIFWDRQARGCESIFTKITAHSADYAFQLPISSSDTFLSVRVGDPVTGVLKPTQSSEKTIQLKAWSVTTWQEWDCAPRQNPPSGSEFCLIPEVIRELPALVSRNFKNFTSTHQAYSAQISPPIFDANNLRAMASGAGSADRIWEDGRGAAVRDPCHANVGRHRRDQAPASSVSQTIDEETSLPGVSQDQANPGARRERSFCDLPVSVATEIANLRLAACLEGGDAVYAQIILDQREDEWGIRSSREPDGWSSDAPSVFVAPTRPIPPRIPGTTTTPSAGWDGEVTNFFNPASSSAPKPREPDAIGSFPGGQEGVAEIAEMFRSDGWDTTSEFFVVPSEYNRQDEDTLSGISRVPTIRGGLPLGGPPRVHHKPPPPRRPRQV